MSPSNEDEMSGSRGTANLVLKCAFCRRESSLDVVRGSMKSYDIERNRQLQSIAQFECRGCEPVSWSIRDGFSACGETSNSAFPSVDLSDVNDGWTDYDEKANAPVSITNVRSEFKKVGK